MGKREDVGDTRVARGGRNPNIEKKGLWKCQPQFKKRKRDDGREMGWFPVRWGGGSYF